MKKFTINMIFASFILFGAINWSIMGLYQIDILNILSTKIFNSELLAKIIYTVVIVACVYMIQNRTYFLPFLGETVLPPASLKEYVVENPEKEIVVTAHGADKVVYWAAQPGDTQTNEDPWIAYGDYSNSGVVKVIDGLARLSIKCPKSYEVNKFGIKKQVLPKHVHYRLINSNGILSEIHTVNVGENCPL